MRRLAKVIKTNRDMNIPVVAEKGSATWAPENGGIQFTDVKYGKITLSAYKAVHKTIVSDEMLEDSDFDLESYIKQLSVEQIARIEEEAFFSGDGKGKPLGIVHQAEIGAVTENIGEITFDDVIDLIYSVKKPYRDKAVFIMSPSAEIMLHKEKHHHGYNPWESPLKKGEDLRLFGHKVYISDQMDNAERGKLPIMFGDFSHILIGERGTRTIKRLTESYADRGQVGFITTERVDITMLGYRYDNGKLVIEPNEAEIVKFIFKNYLDGKGYVAIMKMLNEKGVKTRFGNEWRKNSIMHVLRNYAYTGNLILQTTYQENHLTKKTLVNNGELPKYHVSNSHEAIISLEDFNAVQEEMRQRAKKHNCIGREKQTYPFISKIVCGVCGKNYRRKVTKSGVKWICHTYNTLGKKECPSKAIPEFVLISVTDTVGGIDKIMEITADRNNTLI